MRVGFLDSFETDFGLINSLADSRQLIYVGLPNESTASFKKRVAHAKLEIAPAKGNRVSEEVRVQLRAFLKGDLMQFDLPLELAGTPFQRMVLDCVSRIPYGTTMTYGEVASAISKTGSARAVGTTMACNRLPLIIPCHRVLAVGGLGGYGGGLPMKEQLLRLERDFGLRRK